MWDEQNSPPGSYHPQGDYSFSKTALFPKSVPQQKGVKETMEYTIIIQLVRHNGKFCGMSKIPANGTIADLPQHPVISNIRTASY